MIRKLTITLLAALGFAVMGCEDYEKSDIKNSKPELTLTKPTTTPISDGTVLTITDTIRVAGTAYDDKYVNSLGFRIINLEEDNSVDYTYKVIWNKEAKIVPVPNFPFSYTVLVSNAKLLDGRYRLEVEVGDVQGEKTIQSVGLNLTKLGIKNVLKDSISTVLDTAKTPNYSVVDNKKFIRIKTSKVSNYDEVNSNSSIASLIDMVLGVSGSDTLLMSPKEAISKGLVPDTVNFVKDFDLKVTSLTPAQLDTIVNSRQVRREYNSISTPTLHSVKVEAGKIYAVKLPGNLYTLVYVKTYNRLTWNYVLRFHHKAF